MSQKFTDSLGRDWLIDLDMSTVDRCFKATGFNPLTIIKPEGAKQLEDDPSLHLSVLFQLCAPAIADAKIDIEGFKGGLKSGDVMEACGAALQEALINFCPSRLRDPMRKLSQKGKAVQAALLTDSVKEIEAMDPAEEAKKIREKLKAKSGSNLLGSALESSELIPGC